MIAPTARWILRRRTDAQSAAVPIKISYFNGRVVSYENLIKIFQSFYAASARSAWDFLGNPSQRSYSTTPSIMVRSTFRVWMSMGSIFRMSSERMMRSASFPTSMLPLMWSSWAA